MSVNTSLGITIAVTTSAPATEDEAGYEALTYTNIGEVVNIGEIGPSAAVVNHDAIDKGTPRSSRVKSTTVLCLCSLVVTLMTLARSY